MYKSFIISLLFFAVFSCRKDQSSYLEPLAAFAVNGDTSDVIRIGVYESHPITNYSKNADSFLWSLGDGTTSSESQISIMYTKPGLYTLTLTASKGEKKAISYKKIKVVAPVIKHVVLTSLNLSSRLGRPTSWPQFNKVDLWIEIVQGASKQNYSILSNGSFDAPVIYKSNIASLIDSTAVPIIFEVPQNIIVDVPTLSGGFGYQGIGYGINVYIRDAGSVYLLSSNFWSGVPTTYLGNLSENKFTIKTAFLGTEVEVRGSFE